MSIETMNAMNGNIEKSPRRREPARQGAAHRGAHHVGPVASARANYNRYIALARDSVAIGDAVQTENWHQHADHYFRMMREPTA